MLPFSTWRELFRIPWIGDNRDAVHFLSDGFYLLIALYRAQRIRDFNCLKQVYFTMIESFAQYGHSEAKDTVDRVLQIAWFAQNRRNLYHLIAAYRRILDGMQAQSGPEGAHPKTQWQINRDIEEFVQAFKALIDFGEKDEARVTYLLERPELMDASMAHLAEITGGCDRPIF